MPDGVKGATVNVVASSMPGFLTTMFSLFSLKMMAILPIVLVAVLGLLPAALF